MKYALSIILCAWSIWSYAQKKDESKKDSIPVKKITSYEKLIPKGAYARNGLFDVRNAEGKWYFEIPDSLMKRYILVVTRYVATPQGAGSFGGEKLNEQTVYFEKGQDKKLLMRAVIYRQDVNNETQAIFKAVETSQVNPIVAAFDIKSTNPSTGNTVIDVTDFFRKESAIVSFPASEKTDKKLGGLADDRSFINKINTYPINIEIKTTKTYSTSAASISAGAQTGFITFDLNTSMVLLPKEPMRKRFFDERVGYFANKYTLFDDNQQRIKNLFYIQRYRLEPKTEDVEKYNRGELVEPKKQIVYYIDPATPKKWRPYLIAGVNDWQVAFEQAGFKNAIVAKEWPEADTTMSLEDARYSVIRYYASETPNAYGPRISDPRSGEIIESHVGWFHNVMKLVHNWYMIQAGPLDPRARKMEFDDELMGQLIRFVSSHEIGHTIGLRHNMGASSQTPVAKLRDKKWVEANGHTVSIMDYARFNYVAQPEDHISPAGVYARIGAYDKWAIQWGYRDFTQTKDAFDDQKILNKLIIDSLKTNPKLWFGGEGKNGDPRSQAEDLGDDSMLASDYGIKNLKRVVPNLLKWTYEEGDLYDNLKELHKAVVGQYSRYLYHVMTNIGNQYITQRSADEPGNVYTEIPRDKVKRAVNYLDRQLFEAPLWMYPTAITEKIDANPTAAIMDQQNQILNIVLSPGILFNLNQKALVSKNPYPVSEFLTDLERAVWKNFSGKPLRDSYRRALQRAYVEKLNILINPKDIADGKQMNNFQRSDVRLLAMDHLKHLRAKVNALLAANPKNQTHLRDMLKEINGIATRAAKVKS
ncbi:zinc-dependent metalloprotease [Pedobacter sp. AW1-32]|uniref:zinc-dependent metalloprotease n=1 Tax=Pedobacter sp. AW1-32 TaxID=3383026 RepID=UPI003FEE7B92